MINKRLILNLLAILLIAPLAWSQERAIRPINTASEQLGGTGRYYALLLAIEDYADQDIPDLEHPIKDARKLKSVLEQHYQFDQIQLLENPTRRLILENFELLRRTITRRDNLLVFYAGHGDWEADSQTGYWLPQDAQVDSSVDWIPNSRLVDVLRGIKSRHTLLITDACFSGSIFKTRALGTLRERAFNQLHSLPSRKAMTSGALKTVPDRSVFLEYLVKRLEQNQEPLLTSEQLFSSFKIAVINNSPNQQVPQYGDIQQAGDEGGDFIFIKSLPSVPLPPSVKQTSLVDLQVKAEAERLGQQRLGQQRLNEALSERQRIEDQWKKWQQMMQEDYKRVLAFEKQAVGIELKIESWQRFLGNWTDDNPYSKQDGELRSKAESRVTHLRQIPQETKTLPLGQSMFNPSKQDSQSETKGSVCGLPPNLNEKKQFAFAEKMIEDGMLSSARDYLRCYRTTKPQGGFRFVAMKLEGEVLLQMGESYWPQAQILFEEWLQENPNDLGGDFARLQLGKIHFRFDRPQVAEETLSLIPPSSSLYGSARSLMGQALFQRMLRYKELGQTSKFLDTIPLVVGYHQEALQKGLTEIESKISNYQIGFTLDITGDSKNALPYYERWIELAKPSEEKNEIQKKVRAIREKIN